MFQRSLLAAFFTAFALLSVVAQSKPGAAETHYDRGNDHLTAARYDDAVVEYTRAIELNPRYVDAYNNRGIVYKRTSRYELAIADFTKGISLAPKDADLYANRASIYWLQKDYLTADVDYTRAIELTPKDPKYYVRRGDMRGEAGQAVLAVADYTAAISLDPRQSGVYLNRGVAQYKAGRTLDAFADYRRAIAAYTLDVNQSPKNLDAYFNRGIAYANLEEYSMAINDFTSAINGDPKTMVNVYFERANAYEAVMDFEKAKTDRRTYTQLGGTKPTPQPRRGFYSTASFNPDTARAAFARGNSAIEGIVCTKYKGGIFRASGARVSLFPVTPYLETWYQLREKKEGKNTGIFMSNEAVSYRIDLIANGEGRFYFQDLKPGRYFVQVFHNFTSRHSGRADRGSTTEMVNGVLTTTNYYEDYDYNVGHANRIEKFVDIKADGDSEKITLMKGGGLLKIGGCG